MFPSNRKQRNSNSCSSCKRPADTCTCHVDLVKYPLETAEYVCGGVYQEGESAATESGTYISLVNNNAISPEAGAGMNPAMWLGPLDAEEFAKYYAEGARGEKGDQGDQGPVGDKGDKGDTGDKGDKGDTGEQGVQGVKGDPGDTGPEGSQGVAGVQGVKGDVGPTGEKGEKGDEGVQGVKGDRGERGERGDVGDTGPTGLKGDRGDRGEKGDSAEIDAIGASLSDRDQYDDEPIGFSFYDATTGILYHRVDGGWSSGAEYGKGPKGDTGDKGDQGDQGLKGDRGVEGDQGVPGLKGDQGVRGERGERGDQGVEGPQGIQGQKGDEGPRGRAGDRGPEGVQGVKGDRGPEGIQGVKGDRGDKGEQGEQGVAGETGPSGGPVGPRGQGFFDWFVENVGKVLPNGDEVTEEDVQKWLQGPKGDKGEDLTNECDSPIIRTIDCADENGNLTLNFTDGDKRYLLVNDFRPTPLSVSKATHHSDGTYVTENPNGSTIIWTSKPTTAVTVTDFVPQGVDTDGNQLISFDVIDSITGGCMGSGSMLILIECDNCNCIVPSHRLNQNGTVTVSDGRGLTYTLRPDNLARPSSSSSCKTDTCSKPGNEESVGGDACDVDLGIDCHDECTVYGCGDEVVVNRKIYISLMDDNTTPPLQGTRGDTQSWVGGFTIQGYINYKLSA